MNGSTGRREGIPSQALPNRNLAVFRRCQPPAQEPPRTASFRCRLPRRCHPSIDVPTSRQCTASQPSNPPGTASLPSPVDAPRTHPRGWPASRQPPATMQCTRSGGQKSPRSRAAATKPCTQSTAQARYCSSTDRSSTDPLTRPVTPPGNPSPNTYPRTEGQTENHTACHDSGQAVPWCHHLGLHRLPWGRVGPRAKTGDYFLPGLWQIHACSAWRAWLLAWALQATHIMNPQ